MGRKSKHNPVISMKNISVLLYDKRIFRNTSWDIYSDEFWAILGDTGSGKSTLAKTLYGEYPVVEGEIVYNFNRATSKIYDNPEKEIGYVAFDINREMKRNDNLFVQSRYWSGGYAQSVADYLSKESVWDINPFEINPDCVDDKTFVNWKEEILELLQIRNLMERSTDALSNGECRKIVLARELLKHPSILILDNPFQGLDTKYRKHLYQNIIPLLRKQGIQFLLVTTDKDDIPRSVTHVLCVDSFKVVLSGQRKLINLQKRCPITLPSCSTIKNAICKSEIFSGCICSGKGQKTLIRMSNVTIKAGIKNILNNISWTVKEGENWAVTGPNGSGKTTLLSLILGDHPQIYANDIEVFGIRWGKGSNIWDVKKRTGWMSPELHTCYPRNETCFDVVLSGFFDSVGLFKRGSSSQRKFVRELFALFELDHLKKNTLGSVSEGFQRLVLLMRAIVRKPQLLILDEPCSGLGHSYRKLILTTVDTLAFHLNVTVIYVTHRIDEMPGCINKVMKLNAGRGRVLALRPLSDTDKTSGNIFYKQ